jgi:hypothetical protein
MLTPGNSREQVREYLRCLSPDKQAELLEKIERAVLRGESVEDADIVLAELRSMIRKSQVTTERAGSPSRRFFDPIEPFIVDGTPSNVVRGQIARGSLNPIWIWISRDLLSTEAKSYSTSVARALGADDKKAVAEQVEAFHALALRPIRKALASDETKKRVEESLGTYMGPPRAMADLREIVAVLTIRHALAAVASKLPELVVSFSGEHLAAVKRTLDEVMADCGDAFMYALLLVMKRLSRPWELVRLGMVSGEAANSPYRVAIMLVLVDLEEKVANLRTALRAGANKKIGRLIEIIGATLAGLAAEIDLSKNAWTAQKLNQIRSEVHALLAREIETMPASVQRLFDLSAPIEAARGDLEAVTVAETEHKVALLEIVRTFEGPLSLDTKIAAALSQIRGTIERAVATLLNKLNTAFDGAWRSCLVRIRHAVRICARLFGKEYASEIVDATETAVEDKRHAM